MKIEIDNKKKQLLYNIVLSPLRGVPGPWLACLTPFYIKYFVLRGRKAQKIHELHEKYGPVVRISPSEVAISHLPTVREIYSISSKFIKGDWYDRLITGPIKNVFNMRDPAAHRQRRSLLAHGFTNTALANMEPLILSKVKMAVAKIKRDAADKKIPTDVLKWWTLMATDVIGELAFGECFHALEIEEKTPYVKNLESVVRFLSIRAELMIPPQLLEILGKIIPHPSLKYFFLVQERTQSYGKKAIHDFATSRVKIGSDENPTILAKILGAKDSVTGVSLSLPEIEDEATAMIVAGTDTTAISLTFCIWCILRHPTIHKKLLTELATLPDNFADAGLRNLPYLNAILKEALRLYCAVPGPLPRIVPAGGKEIQGYKIPAGATVSTQPYTLHRDAKFFPEPLKFKPERWLESTPEMNHAFMAFGGGSRVCLGQNLAQIEMRLAISHLFLTVPDLKLVPSCTDESMEINHYFSIVPKGHKCEVTA
ncbi:hypothetical protein RUND412_002096 [Rhizina undulata]